MSAARRSLDSSMNRSALSVRRPQDSRALNQLDTLELNRARRHRDANLEEVDDVDTRSAHGAAFSATDSL